MDAVQTGDVENDTRDTTDIVAVAASAASAADAAASESTTTTAGGGDGGNFEPRGDTGDTQFSSPPVNTSSIQVAEKQGGVSQDSGASSSHLNTSGGDNSSKTSSRTRVVDASVANALTALKRSQDRTKKAEKKFSNEMIIVLAGLAILVTAGLVFMTIGAVRRGAVRRPLTHPIRDCLIIIEYPVHN